jgi:transcriptional regulator with XRE-family HTH domain
VRLNLKIAILASGESQRQVAAKCGIPETRFSEIVRGWAEPRDRERDAIAAALNKPVDELFEQMQASA